MYAYLNPVQPPMAATTPLKKGPASTRREREKESEGLIARANVEDMEALQ